MLKKNRNIARLFTLVLLVMICVIFQIPKLATCSTKEEKIVIRYSDHTPPVSPPARAVVHWQKIIIERTGGKVVFQNTFGGSLLSEADIFRGIEKGIADMAWYPLNPRDGFKANTVMMLPFMGWPDRETATLIFEELLKKFPAMRGEWRTVKLLSPAVMLPTHFHMVRKTVSKPDDLRGLKIATTGEHTEIIKNLGAVPVEIPIGDWFTALERGVVDGCLNHFAVLKVFAFLEKVGVHVVFGEGGVNVTPQVILMNIDTWEKLPKDVQRVFEETQKEWWKKMYEIDMTEYVDSAIAAAKK
ncbi:MAG: TRAP transporter substrate-binding protein DctP, partial [Deltaproteobacteria bacterium]|nr:TRAP transporter substrate-binding protein DctP [Deltaproteobacteria bacterium]